MRWEADVALAEHTRYRIGGPTPGFGRVESRVELRDALAGLAGAPFRVLGRGANLLVADRGIAERVFVLAGTSTFWRAKPASSTRVEAPGFPPWSERRVERRARAGAFSRPCPAASAAVCG